MGGGKGGIGGGGGGGGSRATHDNSRGRIGGYSWPLAWAASSDAWAAEESERGLKMFRGFVALNPKP